MTERSRRSAFKLAMGAGVVAGMAAALSVLPPRNGVAGEHSRCRDLRARCIQWWRESIGPVDQHAKQLRIPKLHVASSEDSCLAIRRSPARYIRDECIAAELRR